MGINKNRFKNLPTGFEDSLACSICSDVVEDPRQCPDEHLFCKLCIEKRIKETASCPQCPEGHEPLTELQLRPLSRPVRQMMDTLEVVCENVGEGCPKVVKLPQLAEHNSKCEFSSHMVQIKADEHSLAKRKLEESFEESTKRIKVLEQFETNAINRVLELESKLQLARQENATLTSKNTLLEKELASNSSAMDTLQTRNKDLNETLGQIRNDFGGKIESLSNSLKQKDEEIVKFEATLVRVRKDRDFYYHQMMTRNAFIAKQALATSVPTTVVAKSCSSTQTATAAVEHKDVAKPNLEWTKKLDYLKEKLDIDRRLFDILKAVDYDKFYKGEKKHQVLNFTEAVRAIKNAIMVLSHDNRVLNLIECPFIAVCLAERLRCTFVVSPRLKSAIVKNGYGDLFETKRLIIGGKYKSDYHRFEVEGSMGNCPFDVIINDWYYMGRYILNQLAPKGRAFDVLNDCDQKGPKERKAVNRSFSRR